MTARHWLLVRQTGQGWTVLRYISSAILQTRGIHPVSSPVNPCPGVHHRILTTPLHSTDHPVALQARHAPAPRRVAHRTATDLAPTRATDVVPIATDPVPVHRRRRAIDPVRGTGGILLPAGTGISGIQGSTIIVPGITIDEPRVDDPSGGR